MNTIYIQNIPNYFNFSDFDEVLEDEFIRKLDRNELFNPSITADELLKPLPNEIKKIPRSMNSFLCFRRRIYLLAVEGGFIDEIRDGRFLTNVVTKVWKLASSEQKNIYTQIAREVRKIDRTRYKGIKIEKTIKNNVNSFVNTYMVNFGKTKTSRRNSSRTRNTKKSIRTNLYPTELLFQPPIIDNSSVIPIETSPSFFNTIDNIDNENFPFPIFDYNFDCKIQDYEYNDCNIYYTIPQIQIQPQI
ncbi:hypothetical protein Glove_23g48 [Diversispora epigaea]|uniref:HMG box domain-containing protein n=1 Tax=Diversispora epigaea TaxID=1348612 RepID=A0A397JVB5_9GLOM|nr:hypothetical protein Glove_23g48 [Diversispora epigaea]